MRSRTIRFCMYLSSFTFLSSAAFADNPPIVCSLNSTCTIYTASATMYSIYEPSGTQFVCTINDEIKPMRISVEGKGDYEVDLGGGEFDIDSQAVLFISGQFKHPGAMLPGYISLTGLSGKGSVICIQRLIKNEIK
jgi:hypothetical protein